MSSIHLRTNWKKNKQAWVLKNWMLYITSLYTHLPVPIVPWKNLLLCDVHK